MLQTRKTSLLAALPNEFYVLTRDRYFCSPHYTFRGISGDYSGDENAGNSKLLRDVSVIKILYKFCSFHPMFVSSGNSPVNLESVKGEEPWLGVVYISKLLAEAAFWAVWISSYLGYHVGNKNTSSHNP